MEPVDIGELGKQPISGEQPAGSDIRYDPDFEQLQGEIDRLSIASADGKGIDWEKVVQLGVTILSEKSKHLLVAAYLGAGLMETQKVEGLATSLRILTDLVADFWPVLFPPVKRMQGRLNAVRWWMERTDSFLTKSKIDPQPPHVIGSLRQGIEELDRALGEKSEDAPNLRGLLDLVNRLPLLEEKPASPPQTAPPPAVSAPAVPASAAPLAVAPSPKPSINYSPPPQLPSVGDIAALDEAERLLTSTLTQVSKISAFLIRQDPANPLCYRLDRMAAWASVEGLPPASGGATMLPPPDVMIRDAIETLLAKGEYEEAVLAAESRIPQFLFWLDLNEFVVRAMGMLGTRFNTAREAVCMETALYVQRLQGVENLSFSDGTPFACRGTKTWLRTIKLGDGERQPTASIDSAGTDALVADAFSKAQAFLQEKKLAEAIQLFQSPFQSADSGRNRLIWQIALSRFLVDVGKPDLARPHLHGIMDRIDRFGLDQWDPTLALSGLKAVYEGMKDVDSEESKELLKNVFDRISGISPVDMLNLLGES
jgi:type VI secretion system protein VasJ